MKLFKRQNQGLGNRILSKGIQWKGNFNSKSFF